MGAEVIATRGPTECLRELVLWLERAAFFVDGEQRFIMDAADMDEYAVAWVKRRGLSIKQEADA